MATFKVSAKKYAAVMRADPSEAIGAVRRGLWRGALLAEPLVVQATPVDRGNTRAAWRVEATREGAVLGNDSPIAPYLETGTRPHTPPLLPLVRWVARRAGLGGIATLADAPREVIGRAVAIQRKIARDGTPPVGMISKNFKEISRLAKMQVERELTRRANALREHDDVSEAGA